MTKAKIMVSKLRKSLGN